MSTSTPGIAGSGAGAEGIGAAALLYPFAEALVPRDGALSAGAVLPCSEAKVHKRKLVATLLGAALWSLREQGVIAIEPHDKKVLFMKRRSLVVRLVGRDPVGAVEAGLVRAIDAGGPDKNPIEFVVFRWLGKESADPFGAALDVVAGELAAARYGSIDSSPGVVKQLKGHPRFTADCARIGVLRPAAERLIERWTTFARNQPELHADLLARCELGVKRQASQGDSDIGGGGGGPDFD